MREIGSSVENRVADARPLSDPRTDLVTDSFIIFGPFGMEFSGPDYIDTPNHITLETSYLLILKIKSKVVLVLKLTTVVLFILFYQNRILSRFFICR